MSLRTGLLAALLFVSQNLVACSGETTNPADSASATGDVSADTSTAQDTAVAQDTTEDTQASQDTAAPQDTAVAQDTAADTNGNAGDTNNDANGNAGDTASPVTCSSDDDCSYCVFDAAPKTVADCQCPFCPTNPMPKEVCAANSAAWESVCGGAAWHDGANCPMPRCVNQPPLTCNEGRCEPGCDPTACPAVPCPLEDQETLPGECCPRCKEKSGCGSDGDCVMCAYPKRVTAPSECECVLCPSFPMTASECAANTAAWQTHCDPWPQEFPCPVALCLPNPPPICDPVGACQMNPNGCFGPEDCGSCLWPTAPQTEADCRCPTCAVPLNTETCAANQQAVDEVCASFDFSACLPPPCPRPPPITCTPEFTCGYDFSPR
jgi:hypothetical protein